MADLQLAVAVKPESQVKRPVSFVSFETSMQSLPRVGLSTGRVTDLSPAFNVTWSRLDTVCAPLWGKRDPSRRGARVAVGGSVAARRGTPGLSHTHTPRSAGRK